MIALMGTRHHLSLGLLALAACDAAPSKLDALATRAAATTSPFVLLGAGDPPRAELRYQLAAQTAAYRAETRLTSRHVGDGGSGPGTALPPIQDGFAITAQPGDGAHTRLALRALEATAVGAATLEVGAYLAEWRATLMDRKIAAVVDARGQLGEVTVAGEASAIAHDQVVQRMLGTLVPVPAEPVGLGASWRVQQTLRQGPATVVQTATYRLVARSATRWTIAIKLQRRGDAQHLDVPEAPPGTVELVDLFRELEGVVEIDPRQPLPVAGKLVLDSRLHTRVHQDHEPDREDLADDNGSVEFLVESMP